VRLQRKKVLGAMPKEDAILVGTGAFLGGDETLNKDRKANEPIV